MIKILCGVADFNSNKWMKQSAMSWDMETLIFLSFFLQAKTLHICYFLINLSFNITNRIIVNTMSWDAAQLVLSQRVNLWGK